MSVIGRKPSAAPISINDFVTLDGAGSGLDADSVDGLQATSLLDRTNHTGSQPASTITNFSTEVNSSIEQSTINNLGVNAATLDNYSATDFVILDVNDKIPLSNIPSIAIGSFEVVADNTERDALVVEEGDIAKVTSSGLTFIFDGSGWVEISAAVPVDSVNNQTGAVVLDTDDISEGSTNKYYSSSLFDADFSGKTTDNLTEGSTNEYYAAATVHFVVMGWIGVGCAHSIP